MYQKLKTSIYILLIICFLAGLAYPKGTASANTPEPDGTPEPEAYVITRESSTPTPYDLREPKPVPEPPLPTIEVIIIDTDASVLINELKEILAESQAQSGASKNASAACLADCTETADRIIRHALDPDRLIPLNIKWSGAALATLERLTNAMAEGGSKFMALGLTGDGNKLRIWYQWYDPVKERLRDVMLVVGDGARRLEGTIFPMGDSNVVAHWGPLKEFVIKAFRQTVQYNGKTANPDAVVYLSDEAAKIIGGGAALGFGFSLLHKGTEVADHFDALLRYWGNCLRDALRRNPEYQEWKRQRGEGKSEFSLASAPNISPFHLSKSEAEAAGKALAIFTGTVFIIKVGVSLASQQYWMLFVPVP